MTRKVTAKDGADAVALLDKEHATRKRTPRLHLDPTTGATVLEPKRPAAKAAAPKPAPKASKAALVRALLDEGKTVKEIAAALKDKGVSWSYAWDVAAAYERKTGKTFIASHATDGAK